MHAANLVLIAAFAGACTPKRGVEIVEAPVTATPEGRNAVRLQLAETLLDSGRTAEASEMLRLALVEGADEAEVKLLQGRAMWIDGLGPEAEALILDAQRGMPRDPRPYRVLGTIHADSGQFDEAIASFERALELEDTDAATWNNLGFILLSEQRYDDARDALTRAVSLDGSNPKYRTNLGFALAASGRYGDALDSFRAAGSEADAHANLGLALELAGEQERAITHYHKALEANPRHASAGEALKRLEAPGGANGETP